MTLSAQSAALIAATKAKRAEAGLVSKSGVYCATPEQKAYLDARYGLTREQFNADIDRMTSLRDAARRSTGRA